MPRPHKSQLRALPEIADSYRWTLAFPTTTPGFPSDANESLNLRCVSSTMPSRTMQGQVDIQIRGHHIMRPGPLDETHNINLVFVETIDNKVSLWLKNLRDAVYNAETGQRQDPDQYVFSLKLTLMDHLDNARWEYDLEGCYIQEYEPGDLSGDAGAGIQPNVTLYYDTFKDGPQGATSYGPTAPAAGQ